MVWMTSYVLLFLFNRKDLRFCLYCTTVQKKWKGFLQKWPLVNRLLCLSGEVKPIKVKYFYDARIKNVLYVNSQIRSSFSRLFATFPPSITCCLLAKLELIQNYTLENACKANEKPISALDYALILLSQCCSLLERPFKDTKCALAHKENIKEG